jgi:diacylglycerol kinase family enzyme
MDVSGEFVFVLVLILGLSVAMIALFALRRSRVVKPPSDSVLLRPAFIVNPKGGNTEPLKTYAKRVCNEMHMAEPLWYETTPERSGHAQTKDALRAGATAVIVCGGDGTVRVVAGAMAHTGVPLGIVPWGTGNLLARNLGLPLNDVLAAMRIALGGENRAIDMARISVYSLTGTPLAEAEPFCVIAGLGFDALVVSETSTVLKRRLGWVAYFFEGTKQLRSPRCRVSISIDSHKSMNRKVRTVLIANCGTIPASIRLVPEASVDDGLLDISLLDARRGIVGWAALGVRIFGRALGIRKDLMPMPASVETRQARRIEVRMVNPTLVQADGDTLPAGNRIEAWVESSALTVRV